MTPSYQRCLWWLVFLGLLARVWRYALAFPLWGDEASLALNLADRDFAGLRYQLDNFQVAPILFLWCEKLALLTLGDSELALRLLPFLAGSLALILFACLAQRILEPLPAVLAVGILAVARWPVTMSANLKPYSLDLLAAVALLLCAIAWLQRPRWVWLFSLTLLTPFAVGLSYPAVFVAGAVSLALASRIWKADRLSQSLFAFYHVVLVLSFLTVLLLVGREKWDPDAPEVAEFMAVYWKDGFPPADPIAFLVWFVRAHTGLMFAYPVGADHGGGIFVLGLCVAGAIALWRREPRVVVLCLTPFLLTFVASILRKYPYGVGCRLYQHLAPGICLLAGVGLSALVSRCQRWRAGPAIAVGLLVVCGVSGMILDAVRPYREPLARWSRETARELGEHATSGTAVVVVQTPRELPPTMRWHLSRQSALVWDGELDRGSSSVVCLDVRPEDASEAAFADWLENATLIVVSRRVDVLLADRVRYRCTVCVCVRKNTP